MAAARAKKAIFTVPPPAASEQANLNNYGFSFLRFDPEADCPGSVTYVVVGVPRSGTTMIARILHELDLLAPTAKSGVVLEDTILARAISDNDQPTLLQEVERRNRDFPRWGTKRPDFYKHIPLLDGILRNPRYIATFRDPLAIAVRNEIAVHQEVMLGVNRAAAETLRLIQSLSKTKSPCLLISYEKALLYPEQILEAIETFCGVQAGDAQRRAVLAAIRPNEPAYVDAARFRYEGLVDGVKDGRAWGWARRVGDARPVEIEVVRERRVLAAGTANLPRPDLKQVKGDCAFDIRSNFEILTGPETVVRIKGTGIVLPFSRSDGQPLQHGTQRFEDQPVKVDE